MHATAQDTAEIQAPAPITAPRTGDPFWDHVLDELANPGMVAAEHWLAEHDAYRPHRRRTSART